MGHSFKMFPFDDKTNGAEISLKVSVVWKTDQNKEKSFTWVISKFMSVTISGYTHMVTFCKYNNIVV